MKRISWQVKFGILLILLSALWYLFHYFIFRDWHHIFIYLIGDIAFVPIEVLLVTLIIHQLLSIREKRSRLEKLNMVIGAFFSEVGTQLLTYLSDFDPKLDDIRKHLIMTDDWSEKEFEKVSKIMKNYDYDIEIQKIDLEELRIFLISKRSFLVRMLENPVLLEHESFTELLMATFHLTEELAARKNVREFPETDIKHLSGDIRRAYILFVASWLDYMSHLKDNYPYLFSLAMRTNPFDEEASPIVQ
ncbi:MAG: hypothetical protein IBX40_08455 [Methanosarcinales archaeon]|nr:hypothetical protein [Methanosarcinales archaeon]